MSPGVTPTPNPRKATMDPKTEDYKISLIELDDALAKLLEPHPEILYQDDPNEGMSVLIMPPLLELLQESIGSSNGGTNRGIGLANTRSILDFSALALMGQIQEEMAQIWRNDTHGQRPKNLTTTITRWHKKVQLLGPNQNVETLKHNTHIITNWVKAIELKFDPPVIIEVIAPCPNCQAETHTNQEKEINRSLRIIWRRSFGNSRGECQECGKTWIGETELRQLRWEIDNDTPTP